MSKLLGKFKAKLNSLSFDVHRQGLLLLTITKDSVYAVTQIVDELRPDKDKVLDVTLTKGAKDRSLDQNALMWTLCDRLAARLATTKEDIYREAISRVGRFDVVCVQDKALDFFVDVWESRGLGWICDVEDSKIKGCSTVYCYYGSSVYDTDDMARLLDDLIRDCQELGIPTAM